LFDQPLLDKIISICAQSSIILNSPSETKEVANTLQDYNAEEINQIAFSFSQHTQTTSPFDLTIDTLKDSATEITLLADQGGVSYQQGDKARGIVTCQSCLGESERAKTSS
jgi:hypothetical protein